MPFLLIEIIILAIVQGIAEFLPISSSGHLIIFASIFDEFGVKLDEKLAVGIVLHLGTLLAIIVFYWKRILLLLSSDRRVILLILVGSIPAAIVGFGLKKYAQSTLESPLVAGFMLIVTGAILVWSKRHQAGQAECRDLSYRNAFIIGLAQAFAILPGVSRSGSTIVAGLGVGLRRDEAATFSFLLAIPAIAGAGLLEIKDIIEQPTNQIPMLWLLIGGTVSFIIGLAALAWLVRWIQEGRLQLFAWWLFILGPAVVLWQLLK